MAEKHAAKCQGRDDELVTSQVGRKSQHARRLRQGSRSRLPATHRGCRDVALDEFRHGLFQCIDRKLSGALQRTFPNRHDAPSFVSQSLSGLQVALLIAEYFRLPEIAIGRG